MTKPLLDHQRVNRKTGRPSAYTPEYHCNQAFKLTLLGATQAEMADVFNLTPETLIEWKRLYPAFSDAIARGKEPADADIANSLYQRARGYSHRATKIFMPAGASEPVKVDYIEHYPPDTNAASLWLRNRRGKKRQPSEALVWRERQEIEVAHTEEFADLTDDELRERVLALAAEIEGRLEDQREEPKLIEPQPDSELPGECDSDRKPK